jgi:hypothetical protein
MDNIHILLEKGQPKEEMPPCKMVNTNILCQPKDFGGLGITNLRAKNTRRPSKWFFRLLNEDGVCQ